LDDDLLEDVKLETYSRNACRDEMEKHATGRGNLALKESMQQIYVDTGYDMSSFGVEEREAACLQSANLITKSKQIEQIEADSNIESTGPQVVQLQEPKIDGRLRLVPKFVAAVVVALRSKFGMMAFTEANRLLIEREYLKTCRESNVRHCDIDMHRQTVINTYFNETLMDEIATVRVRLPAWLRRAFGRSPPAPPTVC